MEIRVVCGHVSNTMKLYAMQQHPNCSSLCGCACTCNRGDGTVSMRVLEYFACDSCCAWFVASNVGMRFGARAGKDCGCLACDSGAGAGATISLGDGGAALTASLLPSTLPFIAMCSVCRPVLARTFECGLSLRPNVSAKIFPMFGSKFIADSVLALNVSRARSTSSRVCKIELRSSWTHPASQRAFSITPPT